MENLEEIRSVNAHQNAADFFEFCCDRHKCLPCIAAVDHTAKYTFTELDSAANRIASWGLSKEVGLKPGDTAALLMENRPEYLFIVMGLAKIGVKIALLNTNVRSKFLQHAINVSDSRVVIVSTAKSFNWQSLESSLRSSPAWNRNLNCWWFNGTSETSISSDLLESKSKFITNHWLSGALLSSLLVTRPDKKLRSQIHERDPLYYIFTSGTTGPSKAAKFSHRRFIGAAITWACPSGLQPSDRIYITLPLYHANAGVLGAATSFYLGSEIILREKFSASNFFKDIRSFNCKATVYIGELWRYLFVQPTTLDDGTPEFSPLRVIIGNGLREDIWNSITKRFHIKQVVEHYACTEMPGDAILNFFNKPGSCGFIPVDEALKKTMTGEGGLIVQYDVEADCVVRDQEGYCIKCLPGEVGELIMRLPDGKYDGYVGKVATQRRLYSNVFADGDCWWSSGDLLKTDDTGFFYFVDRAGDSFRWKGENISTNEVSEIVASFSGVEEANVYGVRIPGSDGRAGMVCVVLNAPSVITLIDLPTGPLPTFSNDELPIVFDFHRRNENDKTSTLKFQKFKYVKDGYDPANCGGDLVWFNKGSILQIRKTATVGTRMTGWIPVDQKVIADILDGTFRF
ncbi:hypothetical protein HK096_006130 [Nowakowskiella sp. JEL0078]|nr:hypothetical protein HK096_006130 [Nowakowskiella sp. JEL0078]